MKVWVTRDDIYGVLPCLWVVRPTFQKRTKEWRHGDECPCVLEQFEGDILTPTVLAMLPRLPERGEIICLKIQKATELREE